MTLRLRLLIATTIAVLVGLAIVDATTYLVFNRSQLRQVDDSLDRAHPPIELLAESNTEASWSAIPQIAPGHYVAILDENNSPLFISAGRRAGDDDVNVDLTQVDITSQFQTISQGHDNSVRVRVDPLSTGTTLVVGESLHQVHETAGRLLGVLLIASAVAIALVAALSWILVRVGLRPLRAVELRAAAITDSDLADVRVPGADASTEVGSLAAALNAMLDRLDVARSEREQTVADLTASEARMRQFVADASHELRTPIAATAAYAELFEQGARDRPADLERAMAGIRSETDRMSALVGDLLLLARLDEHQPLGHATVDLTELVFQAVDTARTIDPSRPVRPSVDGVITVNGDATRLRQVIDNLLANVRSHTPPGTPCTVSLTLDGSDALLSVSDVGPGVSDEQLTKLTDRFYRVDHARTRTTGGSGLGLSIVDSIVAAHGGSISASHHQPTGLTISVRLPNAASLTHTEGDTE
ncbi:MAG: ATP-binding protein [Acidimicrobiales bacterium]